jgi:mannose/fructose/N-acetylgalactosamine-specific phosphotransferase system component IIC
MSPLELAGVLLWGVLVGLDLVSVGQTMISRPLIAASVTGLLLGDPVGGVIVGMVLELYALEVLPVGASRYPDYGPASVAAAVVAAGNDPLRHLGVAVATGLLVAYIGEYTILELRRRNSRAVERHMTELSTGNPLVIRAFHRAGLARDALRALLLTAAGLGIATVSRQWPPLTVRGASLLDAVVVGAGVSSAVSGILHAAGGQAGFRWFTIGLVVGGVLVLVI